MKAIQRSVIVPKVKIFEQRAAWRKVFGDRPPLAAGAQNVHHAVDHLADIDAPFAAAGLARRDQRLDMRPLLIGQIARIEQFVAVVTGAVFISLHGHLVSGNNTPEGITIDSASSRG